MPSSTPRREVSEGVNPVDTLVLGFCPLELREVNVCGTLRTDTGVSRDDWGCELRLLGCQVRNSPPLLLPGLGEGLRPVAKRRG